MTSKQKLQRASTFEVAIMILGRYFTFWAAGVRTFVDSQYGQAKHPEMNVWGLYDPRTQMG